MQLESLGISDATLFPEIEKVAGHIKASYYEPDPSVLNGLGDIESKIINRLAINPNVGSGDLALMYGLSIQTVSRALSNLLTLGLIERKGTGRGVSWRVVESVRQQLVDQGQ